MKTFVVLACALAASALAAAERPWQQLTNPTAAEAAKLFAAPPPEHSMTVTWGWNGPMTEQVIVRDLDALKARGFLTVTIEAGYAMDNAPYLSDGWFKLIRFAAEEAGRRGMRVWIIDEGKYPSGFANGKFSAERPDLRMQGLAVAERIDAPAGQAVAREIGPDVVGVIALNTETGENHPLALDGRKLAFTAPATGKWQLLVVDHQFRTGDTRAVSDATRGKTTKNHMGDLLSAAAVKQWMTWTHEEYRRHVGDQFGSVILGFRGDEPDFAYTPWNASIVDEFKRRKGYDPTPYLAYFASFPRPRPAGQGGRAGGAGGAAAPAPAAPPRPAPPVGVPPVLTDAQRRAKADYWDVWSELFAGNFFQQQAEWCAAHGVEYITHLNQDHDLTQNVRSSGDFFRDLRSVQVPGIDVIWSQIYPGRGPADFPKFASSVAHVYGHPRTLSESFAAFYDPVTPEVARWAINQQLARGITLFECMFFSSSAGPLEAATMPAAASGPPQTAPGVAGAVARVQNRGRRYFDTPEFPALAAYAQRCQYLLSQGRPAAQIGVYLPTTSFWLDDREANAAMLKVVQQLLEAQRDFDFVDEHALAEDMKLAGGVFTNRSGQAYRAIIVPPVTAIGQKTLERLRTFAQTGGRVIFLGRGPAMAVGRTFLHAPPPGDLGWATRREPAGEVTPAVLAALPPPEVAFDAPAPAVKYSHRRLRDADVYFFFNEGEPPLALQATLAGRGPAEVWDAHTGRAEVLGGAVTAGESTRVPLTLGRYESKIIVIRSAKSPLAAF